MSWRRPRSAVLPAALAAATAIAFLPAASSASTGTPRLVRQTDAVPGRYLVVLRDDAGRTPGTTLAASVADDHGAAVLHRFGAYPRTRRNRGPPAGRGDVRCRDGGSDAARARPHRRARRGDGLAWVRAAVAASPVRAGGGESPARCGGAVWHLPLFWTAGSALEDASPWVLILELPAVSVLFTWVYVNTSGSALFAILFPPP